MASKKDNGKTITTQAGMDKAVKGVCNILRRDKAKGARLYVPELTWMFFLRFLDVLEETEEAKARAVKKPFHESIPSPYRWRDWAAPFDKDAAARGGTFAGWKRHELTEKKAELNGFLSFVNGELFPFLVGLKEKAGASAKQKVIGEIFANKERTVVASQTNLLDVLDRVHGITAGTINAQHMFPISQAFEGLLPSLGEKKNDGGQFFTPREVIRLIVNVVNPTLDKTVYADILSPFLGAVGAHGAATGWWTNLRSFSMDRFAPPSGGGRLPVERYLSCELLNRVTYYELEALRGTAPSVMNGLPTDKLYPAGSSQPARNQEVLQSWDAIAKLNGKLVREGDQAGSLSSCLGALKRAQGLYDRIGTGIELDPKSNDQHIEPLKEGIRLFANLAEIDLPADAG